MSFWHSFFRRTDKTPKSKSTNKVSPPLFTSKTYRVKYLGVRPTVGLWGVKHTRKPVDSMVEAGKRLLNETSGQLLDVDLTITNTAVLVTNTIGSVGPFPIETIAYGVQDIVYSKFFAMIVLQENTTVDKRPFLCYAFLCDSASIAESIAFALAQCFKQLKTQISSDPNLRSVQLINSCNQPVSNSFDEFMTSSEA